MRTRQPCGTNAAYQRHKARREPVDDACRRAHAAYSADYYRRRATPVEQAILRGWTTSQIMRAHHVDYAAVHAARARITAAP